MPALPTPSILSIAPTLPALPLYPITAISLLTALALLFLAVLIAFVVVFGVYFAIALRDTFLSFKEALEEALEKVRQENEDG